LEDDSGEPPVAPPVNLLQNASFEDDDSSWNIWGGAVTVTGEAHDGVRALEATATNGAEQLVTALEPNTVYRLSGWGRSAGPEPILIGVKDYGGAELRVSFSEAEYREDSLTFTTGLSNTTAVVYAYKHADATPAYADALVLTSEGPSARTPTWSDEFDGEGALDPTRWTSESGFVRNEELQWYQADNAFQEDGVLVIEGRTEDRPNPNYEAGSTDWRTSRETIQYTSASVTTKDLYAFEYGTLVVRAKVTNFTGTWPAIWTLGTSCEWPSSGEIDVMENYGGNILANFAWGTNTRWSAEWDASRWPVADFGAGWTDDFHIWELEWSTTRMVIRLDGQVLNDVSLADTINGSASCAGQNPFQQSHYILLNLALGGAGGSVSALSFPTRYLVDYVRVYEPI
ncbi:MAG: hypothetical protein CL927_03895, partial [Deltaproteobacteria bacterium]|nr:hypothetical protein [Deltaproteobacteria bacterium]